jgi:Protein of unknown function (DUF2934)
VACRAVAKEVSMIEQKELKQEEIAHRAYELYLQRGREPGKDVEDWTRAERELSSEVRRIVGNEGGQTGRN